MFTDVPPRKIAEGRDGVIGNLVIRIPSPAHDAATPRSRTPVSRELRIAGIPGHQKLGRSIARGFEAAATRADGFHLANAEAFADANEDAIEELEAEARRRAVNGVDTPVYH